MKNTSQSEDVTNSKWLQYLEQRRKLSHFQISEQIRTDTENWLSNRQEISMKELDDIITFHNNYS